MSPNRISIERRAASAQRYIQTSSISDPQMVSFNLRPTSAIERFDPKVARSFYRFGTVADRQRSGRPPVSFDYAREIENAFN